jgi:hypothetical protein
MAPQPTRSTASVFAGYDTTSHLQLVSTSGASHGNNDGFEEWSYLSCADRRHTASTCCTPPPAPPLPPAPEPGVLALFGLALVGASALRRRAAQK